MKGFLMITRAEVVQRFLDLYRSPAYLEIGVFQGETFRRVQAAHKVAVDPAFQFDPAAESAATGMAEYHQTTSDQYFGKIISNDLRFDVIYLDGLHTFEQTLRDLLNALAVLRPNGTIIIDDTIPNSYHAALSDWALFTKMLQRTGSDDHSWMGDVYRLVYFIQTFLQQYSYATVEENHGQTVLWRQPRPGEALEARNVEDIARLEYAQVATSPEVFAFKPLAEIVDIVRSHVPKSN
jgi:hypothetical protein